MSLRGGDNTVWSRGFLLGHQEDWILERLGSGQWEARDSGTLSVMKCNEEVPGRPMPRCPLEKSHHETDLI